MNGVYPGAVAVAVCYLDALTCRLHGVSISGWWLARMRETYASSAASAPRPPPPASHALWFSQLTSHAECRSCRRKHSVKWKIERRGRSVSAGASTHFSHITCRFDRDFLRAGALTLRFPDFRSVCSFTCHNCFSPPNVHLPFARANHCSDCFRDGGTNSENKTGGL